MQKQAVISVVTKDRPGIIAAITKAILDAGGDIADLNQTIVCDYLTMLLGVSFSTNTDLNTVKKGLFELASTHDFEITVKELTSGETLQRTPIPQESYILTMQGPNRSGIVHAISAICGKCKVNIIGLNTSLENDQYTMALQLDIAHAICSTKELRQKFQAYAEFAQHTMMMQHNDIFQATNEVTLH